MAVMTAVVNCILDRLLLLDVVVVFFDCLTGEKNLKPLNTIKEGLENGNDRFEGW